MKLGTHIISSLLAYIILFNSINVTLTYAYYYLDPIDFIERLCENKDKPALQCNGKCQLNKVSKEYQSDAESPAKDISFKRIQPFVFYKPEIKVLAIVNTNNTTSHYHNLYTYLKEYTIFHPPQI